MAESVVSVSVVPPKLDDRDRRPRDGAVTRPETDGSTISMLVASICSWSEVSVPVTDTTLPDLRSADDADWPAWS